MAGRRPRARDRRGEPMVGRRFEAVAGPVAHGGHVVARVDDGGPSPRVVFVRHALPGERLLLEVTEGTTRDRFWRADAVQVLAPSPERVPAPCPLAGPGGCGGCDFQHVAPPAQRGLKAAVVREQLVRLGGLDDDPLLRDLVVERVPNPRPDGSDPDDGLRWRTRTRFVPAADGRPGLRRHRSHSVVPVDDCLITIHPPEVRTTPPAEQTERVERVEVAGVAHDFRRAGDGFWQVHPGAPEALVSAVLDALAPEPGESVLDLYGGVGLFAAFLADAVGPGGRVALVEGDPGAAAYAQENLPPGTTVSAGDVAEVLACEHAGPVDLVVLDPPRAGAKRSVVDAVAAREPRAVAYVACDPAALARDVALLAGHGYRLASLRGFDLFPMTHHVECVALLVRETADAL